MRALENLQGSKQYKDPQTSPTQSSCQICNMINEQIKCIISQLLTSLKHMKVQESNQNNFTQGAFKKLIKLIFHSKCKNFRSTMNCEHLKIQSLFLEFLNIDAGKLDRISNKKLTNLAKYAFHMDVVSQQVKSFTRHFQALENRKENKSSKKKIISPEKTQRTKIPSKKTIQLKQKTLQNQEAMIKQQAEINQVYKQKKQYVDFNVPGTFTFHPTIAFQNEYSALMNNMMMMGYAFHPNPN